MTSLRAVSSQARPALLSGSSMNQGLPLSVLWQGSQAARWLLRSAWFANLLLCLVLGLIVVQFHWSGLALQLGGTRFYISIYPPLLLCTLWMLWFGVAWGAIPAYLTSLSLALYGGMPLHWGAIFALSNVLGFVVMGTSYRAIQLSYTLRSPGTILFFLAISFISSVFSATGSFIWSYYNHLDGAGAFAIWQGWWLGNFVQTALIVGPMLALFSPTILHWRQTHFPMQPVGLLETWRLIVVSVFAVVGVLGFLWLSFYLSHQSVIPRDNSAAAWQHLASVMQESTVMVYWIMTILFLAMVFLGYQFFLHWTRTLEHVAMASTAERDLARQRQAEAESARNELDRMNQEMSIQIIEIRNLQRQLQDIANRDPLTHLYNRRFLHEMLPLELQRAQRQDYGVCVVMLDLDFFKKVNDQHGHAVGDAVLLALSGILRTGLRSIDLSTRYGGEEFCLVLSNIEAAQALACVEQLQRSYAAQIVMGAGSELTGLTFSAGLAMFPQHGLTESALIQAADQALYQAKADGRNCARFAV